jgi:hypothetical protein
MKLLATTLHFLSLIALCAGRGMSKGMGMGGSKGGSKGNGNKIRAGLVLEVGELFDEADIILASNLVPGSGTYDPERHLTYDYF